MEPDFIHHAVLKNLQKDLNEDFQKFSVSLQATYFDKLRRSLEEGALAIVVGAGVSAGVGVPLWSGLITKLLGELGVPGTNKADLISAINTKSLGALALARYLENEAKFLPVFNELLHRALYSDLKLDGYRDPTMRGVLSLCRKEGEKGARRVLTYNFDDLLELHAEHGTPPIAIHSICCDDDETLLGNNDAVPIYHAHGSLPVDSRRQPTAPLIFSERFYHHAYFDWSTFSNRIQLDTFAKYSCLFVGVSLSDPNMRRLLDTARRHNRRDHFIVFKSRFLSEGSSSESAKFLDFVSERDAQHFGVSPIWIKDHSEVPSILAKIRA